MPPLPGEELVLTLFADIHYYVNAPDCQPQQDRFCRGSYVYLFRNPIRRKARLEVANHAGTPDQDAFSGFLDTIILSHSQKQPSLTSITVDGIPVKAASPKANDQSLWSLPIYDMRREHKYLYRLHTLDLYFWTSQDAARFVNSCRANLTAQQLHVHLHSSRQQSVAHRSHSEHVDAHHPVVQQLEQVAISDPYVAISDTTSSAQPLGQDETSHSSAKSIASVSAPTPAAYNPAAPAEPEPIAHREKTPPPPETMAGTGLVNAATMEHPNMQFANHHSFVPQQAFLSQQSPYKAQDMAASTSSFPPPPPVSPPAMTSQNPTPVSFVGPPREHHHSTVSSAQYASVPRQQHVVSPVHSPVYGQYTPVQSPGFAAQQAPNGIPPPPPGGPPPSSAGVSPGFSNYMYTAGPQTGYVNSQDASVHQQFYRPTEAEMAVDGHQGSHASLTAALSQQGSTTSQAPPNATGVIKAGRFDDRLGRVEKGVNRWLKKLDNKV